MELKDFIKSTIKDISDAIIELNEENKETGLQVNPVTRYEKNELRYTIEGNEVYSIDFNLQVSINEEKEKGAGLKINVIQAGLSKTNNDQSVSSIKFNLLVSFPTISR